MDKLATLAAALPNVEFDIIGSVGSAAKRLGRMGNVRLVGHLGGGELALRLEEADVGIGTLALHRNQMSEASPLKTREYLAAGLPVVISYEDTDFPHGATFLLRIPNTEDNVQRSVTEIAAFIERWKGRRVPLDELKAICQVEKERRRLAFMGALVQAWVRGGSK